MPDTSDPDTSESTQRQPAASRADVTGADGGYVPPELVVYGKLRQLTLSVGQSGADGGSMANQMRK